MHSWSSVVSCSLPQHCSLCRYFKQVIVEIHLVHSKNANTSSHGSPPMVYVVLWIVNLV